MLRLAEAKRLQTEWCDAGAPGPSLGSRKFESVRAKLANPDRHVVCLDVNDHHALREAAHDFINRCGKVHVVIASAGICVGTLSGVEEDLPV